MKKQNDKKWSVYLEKSSHDEYRFHCKGVSHPTFLLIGLVVLVVLLARFGWFLEIIPMLYGIIQPYFV